MIEDVWSDRAFFTPLCWCCQMRLLHSKHRTQERSSSLLHPCPWFSSMAQPCIPWKWWRSAFPEENWPGLWFFCLFIGEKARKTILIYIGGNREVSGIPFFTCQISLYCPTGTWISGFFPNLLCCFSNWIISIQWSSVFPLSSSLFYGAYLARYLLQILNFQF